MSFYNDLKKKNQEKKKGKYLFFYNFSKGNKIISKISLLFYLLYWKRKKNTFLLKHSFFSLNFWWDVWTLTTNSFPTPKDYRRVTSKERNNLCLKSIYIAGWIVTNGKNVRNVSLNNQVFLLIYLIYPYLFYFFLILKVKSFFFFFQKHYYV